MGRKFQINYVRIKNNLGKSRQVILRKAVKRKINPLRRNNLDVDKLYFRKTRRRTDKSRGIK